VTCDKGKGKVSKVKIHDQSLLRCEDKTVEMVTLVATASPDFGGSMLIAWNNGSGTFASVDFMGEGHADIGKRPTGLRKTTRIVKSLQWRST